MGTKPKSRAYSKEFKQEAVAMVTNQGYTVPEAAGALGINPNLIYNWRAKLQDENNSEILTISEREELKNLRKENKILRMEKEILKKASAFFAKELE